jgi:hypothetical protein
MASNNGGKGSPKPEDELKVYINGLNEKLTAPWIIRDYQEKGALSDVIKAQIVEQFGLEPSIVEELSILIGNSLDVASEVSLAKVTREKAVFRAYTRLDDAARLARRMKADHRTIEGQLALLQTYFDESGHAAHLLASLQAEIASIQLVVGSLEAQIDELAAIEHGVAEIEPDDKRGARDTRREHVVRSCCYIWEDAGRAVSYTSKSYGPTHQRRSGPLVDLVHIITQNLTDPPTKLPGETIRRDIDTFKNLRGKGRI